jgi:nicotinate phosphoribosyltransferase
MNNVEIGPQLLETRLSAGLDYYKPTMAQVELEHFPNEQVTFTLKNRGQNNLSKYVDPIDLSDRLRLFKSGWSKEELDYLATQQRRDGTPLFSEYYLNYLEDRKLPDVEVDINEITGDLSVTTSGDWPLVTFWETIVMSEINELYFENMVRHEALDIDEIYNEGDRRLTEKINILKTRPDIKFAEFGTRRRFSLRWQDYVLGRLASECPENLIGTSNVALAEKYGLMPIGTFAHEMPMVYAAMSEIRGNPPLEGHGQMLRDWQEMYGDNLSTALTDTFGSDFFFTDFTPDQAKTWQGLRHDSGNPFAFGEEVIDFYDKNAVDSHEKTIVFSDGLDIETIVQLADYFKGKINIVFGWGTTLTNDLGLSPEYFNQIDALHLLGSVVRDDLSIKANNFVMKATSVNGSGTVKLSDNIGKHTGEIEDIDRYIEEKSKIMLGHQALTGVVR